VSTYDWLLFLHLLAAFAAVATVVIFSAFAFGWTRDGRVLTVANVLWAIGGLGTIGFGIWLALYLDTYSITDGWIIAAIVLWAIASELGRRAQVGYMALTRGPAGGSDAATAEAGAAATNVGQAQLWHWLRSLAILALLVVMIYKPGA
jgi:hypothetical protein